MKKVEEVSLYFHIPFCTKKCAYCHFYVIPENEMHKQQLMQALQWEWEKRLPQLETKNIATIYFGGGTPSLLGPSRISKILAWIRQRFSLSDQTEITLEANPENIDFDLMRSYHQVGINRISLGVQTLSDPLLKKLGRLHSSQKAISAIYETVQAGISNVSIDLMYDLPGQSLAHWEDTLLKARELPITHLSLYNLTIEPHTLFFKQRKAILAAMPSEEISLEMYQQAIHLLEEKEFIQYEISAFARSHHQSKHNTGYWVGRPFLGFGPSAYSYWEEKRFRNCANLSQYGKLLGEGCSPVDFEEKLPTNAAKRELLTIQLRLREGVDLELFQQRYGNLEEETFKTLCSFHDKQLIQLSKNRVQLTQKGILFYDAMAVDLI